MVSMGMRRHARCTMWGAPSRCGGWDAGPEPTQIGPGTMATDLKRLRIDRITATNMIRLDRLTVAGYDRSSRSVRQLRHAVARGLRAARSAPRWPNRV